MSVIRAIKKSYEEQERKGWDKTFWFFDIHSSIIKPNYKYGDVPTEMYPYAQETLQFISKLPEVCMVLWTCSHTHEILEYINLFKKQDIVFTYINDNPEVPTQVNGYGCYDKKPYMNVLIEDKAGFDPHTEWLEILNFLKDKYVIQRGQRLNS